MSEETADRQRFWPTRPLETAGWSSRFGYGALTALLLAEVLVLTVVRLPMSLSWDNFAFMDQGANLAVQTLLDRGLVPTVDFGYIYGLLPLLIGRFWFRLVGLSPYAYAAAMLIVDLLIAWGLARCASAMKVGPAGIALIVIAMPWAALASYINLAHAVEAALICHALAEHALGRKQRALALLTACIFVKPTMAYVYGLLLVLLLLRDVKSSGVRGLLRALAPSTVTAIVLFMLCGCWFGFRPLVSSLLPLVGAASYRNMHYGFFHGIGRQFWLPDNVRPSYYLLTPAGQYLVGTLILLGAAVIAFKRKAFGRSDVMCYGDEVIACCGIMQLTFLTAFYAAATSWMYYYYVLVIGLAGTAARGSRSAALIGIFAIAALVGDKYEFSWIKSHWTTTRPTADMASLWTDEDQRRNWQRVRAIAGTGQISLLSTQGEGLTTIMPEFAPAETMFLVPGIPVASELNRKLAQVAAAKFVLVRDNTNQPFLDLWPEFRAALDGCELAMSSPEYLLYRRLRPPSVPSMPTKSVESPTGETK